MKQISIVNIIIDHPWFVLIEDVFEGLRYATIDGHRVLHVMSTSTRSGGIYKIPHPGHTSLCECDQEGSEYRRNYDVVLILDGKFEPGMENSVLEYNSSTMIMVNGVTVSPNIKNYERYTIGPWEEKDGN